MMSSSSSSNGFELTTTTNSIATTRHSHDTQSDFRRHALPRRRAEGEAGLDSLPLELQYLILSHLDLSSLITLRHTYPLYRHVITPDVVRRQFTARDGRPDPVLHGCCTECLCIPGLDRLIVDTTRPSHTWRSICFRCWRDRLSREHQRKHWPLVEMVNGDYGYICHFCTWPVHSGASNSRIKQLHAPCRVRRLVVVVSWLIMAIIQFGLGMLAAVLAWTMFRNSSTVLIPASIDFGLAILALCIFVIRVGTTNEQTYTRALASELIITFIRIPPVTYTARETVISETTQGGPLPKFGFGVFLINLIFRLLDMVGYTLLNCGYDPRSIFLGGLPLKKKLLYGFCTFMVWFAFIPF
ncbi:uncharacterized protein F4807DRAFT_440214 [Annulohypoxylon truncatum]|uniref:uncharacterized protein n=1 Tax=Annulohypoxylon truncatum TaxID=327061 RepID=UPI00200741E1|nr:uncharacterized protein F4807DRAFT_440214 [Annulohypoxylon truncatum]KAI1206192.1 hypothetical protein F4807DRAFT_440214 [Annulohypoxylon truncatum]